MIHIRAINKNNGEASIIGILHLLYINNMIDRFQSWFQLKSGIRAMRQHAWSKTRLAETPWF
jgi:hypothetical protein